MRILHITRVVSIGGTEKVIRQICEVSRGQFERMILCAADGGGISTFNGCIDKYYEIDDMQKKDPFIFFKILFTLSDVIRKEHIDVIHVHHRMAAMYIKILNIFFHKTLIYNGHCIHEDKRSLTKIALNGYHIIAVGNKVKKNLVDFHKIDSRHIKVIPNTVDKSDGIASEDQRLSQLKKNGNILVGNVGRLSKQKGQRYFLQAASSVIKKFPNVFFILVGDGECREELERFVDEMSINDRVIFLGFRDDVRDLMHQFDILVLSSLWEGLPLVPIEAFSVGKAVIASNIDGTDEIVEDGINGILYDPYGADLLAEKICHVISDPKEWARLSQNALESYEKKYSYQIFSDRYKEYYHDVCSID